MTSEGSNGMVAVQMEYATKLLGFLEEQVARRSDQLACRFLRDDGGTIEWTYADLQGRWRAVGGLLAERCQTGDRALLLLPQGLNFVAAFFGCLAAGVVAVPAYPPRPRRPSPRLERIIADCGVTIVLTDRATRDQLASSLPNWPQLAQLTWIAVDDIPAAAAERFQYRFVPSDAPCFLQYTSGSTGDPKGVMVTDRNLVTNVQMISSGRAQVDEIMVVSWQPLLHDMGLIANLLTPLFNGGAVTLMSPAAFLQRPLTWLEAISRYRGTHCGGPDFAYDLCVERVTPAEAAALDLSCWKQAFCGAEPIRIATLDRFARHFAAAGFRRDFYYPCYGLAEGTLIVAGGQRSGEPKTHVVDRAALAERRLVPTSMDAAEAKTFVGCGGQLLDQEIRIVDAETRRPLADGELGEIWTRGPSTAAGYWNRPELSQAIFQAETSTGDRGYLRTGDLGFLRDGELFVAGRLKDLIILRGVNLYPQDIEQTVCEAHAAVAPHGAAVVSVEIDDEERLLVVAEVTREQRKGNLDEVLAAVREAVTTEHEIRPDVIVLIAPLSLPRTTSGKVQRSKCREMYLAGELTVLASWQPQRHEPAAAPTADSPSTTNHESPLEWLAAEIGRRVGLPAAEVDVRAPFARFGIDSADAVEIADALGRRLGRSLPATLVYEYPTIESLVQYLTENSSASAVSGPSRSAGARQATNEPLAVVGMACRFPGGADSPEAFWKLLRDGIDAVGEVPRDRWDVDFWYDADPETPAKMSTRRGGFLRGNVNDFDAAFFGIAPREAAAVDPQQRLLLETAWHAVEDAGLTREQLQDSDTGVFVGISTIDYTYLQAVQSDPRQIDVYSGSGGVHSLAAGRLSYFLGLRGPCFAVDTACSSSLVALHSAGLSLRNGECRAAIVGGVNLLLSPDTNVFFSKMRAMSPDGKCKTFDAAADGYVRGEGCGVVVLKRLSDALADGDRIHAVLRGSAVNHGGRSNGLFAPNAPAQERVIRQALAAADVQPEEVDYVEAHGTGTALGDPIELRALAAALGRAHTPERPLRVGTAKTNVGHMEAAAGMSGLLKAILSLKHEELAPLLHFQKLNPHISLEDGRIALVLQPTAWPRGERPRFAGVSSFGFGGTNAHVIVEEAPQSVAARSVPAEVDDRGGEWMLVVSAPSAEALDAACSSYAEHLQQTSQSLDDVCYAAAVSRTQFNRRAVAIASTREEMTRLLVESTEQAAVGKGASRGSRTARAKLIRGEWTSGRPPRTAWLFSGQGSQYAGMGRDLYDAFPVVRRTLDRCQEVLRDELPIPLLDAMFRSPEQGSPIDDTTYTQPALFALGYALAELWRSWGIEPSCMIGHSIGEYVAACCAGVFSLEDALRLTTRRGRLMQQAPGDGLMAAVFASEQIVLDEIAAASSDVSIAAVNSDRNTVVSGERGSVQTLLARLAARGIQSQTLVTSHAFHSSLMDPMLAAFAAEAERVKFSPPRLPLFSNLTGTLAGAEVATADYWTRHLRAAVRFADGLRAATSAGCDVLIELGPKPVLLGLARDVLGEAVPACVPSLRPGSEARSTMLQGLAELYVRGAAVRWPAVFPSSNEASKAAGGSPRNRVALPSYPFQRQTYALPWTAADYERRLQAERSPTDDGHPLLGLRLDSPPTTHHYRRRLAANAPVELADHRIFEQTVFPAAGFGELALAAAAKWFGRHAVVVDLKIHRPLMLPGDDAVTIQTVVYKETAETARFEVYRKADDADAAATRTGSDAWVLHAEGRCDARDVTTSPFYGGESLDGVRRAATDEVDVDAMYLDFRTAGLDYGPAFRTVRQLHRGPGRACGKLSLTDDGAPRASAYQLEPMLLDGAFQMLAACLPEEFVDEVYLPTGCERLEVLEPLDGRGWADVRLRPTSDVLPDTLTADVRLWTEAGRPAAYVAGLVLTRVPRGEKAKPGFAEWLYELTWESREPARSAETKPRKILVAADAADPRAAAVVEQLTAAGCSVRCDVPPAADATTGEPDLTAWTHWLDSSGTNGSSVDAVAYLAPLPSSTEPDAAELEACERRLCGDVLALSRVMAARSHAPQFFLLTAGAQTIGDEDTANVAHAPLWGLARSLVLEAPQLRCVRIDLPATTCDAADFAAMTSVLLGEASEDQIAVRGGATFVARLRRYTVDESKRIPATTNDATYRLKIGRYGILDSLYFEPVLRQAPAAGEVEIAVRAAALNFRDVLHALGMLREHAERLGIESEQDMPLGFECAGIVTAVGQGVENVRVGDEVLAGPAVGCLAGHVVVPAAFVAKKPKSLGFAEAAALPIAYLTACYALEDRARLRAGERVLIHSAAGGVGQAAVQVAQLLGAEVFATAGVGKWEVLRRQGVRQLMNSRDLAFVEHIASATNRRGVDVVLNSLNGEYIPSSLRSLAAAGRFVEIGKLGVWEPDRVAEFRPDAVYHPFDLGEVAAESPSLVAGLLRKIVERIDAGRLQRLPVESFALVEAAAAFRQLSQAKHIGKVVLTMPTEAERPDAAPVRSDRTYLVTGGLGALGLRTAEWLADQGATSLALVGRNEPRAEALQTIESLRHRGVAVRTFAVDVARAAEVDRLVDEIGRTLPPLAGVVHAAGVLDDGLLQNQTWGRFRNVFGPKLLGAWNLHRATERLPLDFFVCYSSVAATLGSPGQSNYAAANAFLDALVQLRRSRGLPGLSVAWGPWAGRGMASGGKNAALERTMPKLPARLAFAALASMFRHGPAHVMAARVAWPAFFAGFPADAVPPSCEHLRSEQPAEPTADRRSAQARTLVERLPQLSAADRLTAMTDFIQQRVEHIFGCERGNRIDPTLPLQQQGLDSLMGVELKNQLELELGTSIPVTTFFDGVTIVRLAEQLVEPVLRSAQAAADVAAAEPRETRDVRIDAPASGIKPPTVASHDRAAVEADAKLSGDPTALLAELDGLSDEEVERLLQAALRQDEVAS
jgi:phthiocerol/phenolphthiocerol synthesis type-I polyketide synthase C